MIAAERLLLASALEEPSNQRFVLLSDRFVASRLLHIYIFIHSLLDHLLSDAAVFLYTTLVTSTHILCLHPKALLIGKHGQFRYAK